MKKTSKITVVDNENLRGVLAPAGVLSKKVLEDMVDFIELSSEASAQQSADRIEEADKKKSWLKLSEVRDTAEETD